MVALKKIKVTILLLVLSGFTASVFGQQASNFGQYIINPFILNPSTAGLSGYTEGSLLYRKQWVGVSGAPESQLFTFQSRFKNEVSGFGISFNNDVVNILGRTGASVTYSHKVNLNQDHKLLLGISAGIGNHRIMFDKIRAVDPFETSLLTNMESKSVFDGNVGATYQFKRFQLGFASQQLFGKKVEYTNATDEKYLSYNLIRHFTVSAEYAFPLNKNLALTPLILIKSAEGMPLQYDINALLKFKDKVWGAVSYRNASGYGLTGGVLIEERFGLAYTFELPSNQFMTNSSGTHELSFSVRFGKPSKKSGAYMSTDPAGLNRLLKENQEQFELLDRLKFENEKLKESSEKDQQLIKEQKEEIEQMKIFLKEYQEETSKIVSNLKFEGPSKTKVETFANDEADYYVIVGVFKILTYAKLYQNIVKREMGLNSLLIEEEKSGFYFVYTQKYTDFKEAEKELKKVTRQKTAIISGNPWIYRKIKK